MGFRTIASFAVAVCVGAGPASASSIGVFFDAAGTDCDAQVPENSSFSIYIIAILVGDAAAAGVTGAEYRLLGADPGWSTAVTPNSTANLALGSPIDGYGANIAWPACQKPAAGMLLLHTISVFSPGLTSPRTLTVEPRYPSRAGPWVCPIMFLCDVNFTLLCVRGGAAFINSPITCDVAVQPATWTQVKDLYTN